MTDNNDKKRENNFDENGKFAPGNTVSKKRRDRTQTDKLLTALKKAGQKRGQKFWDVAAEKAFIDKEIMKLIISKLVPTLNELSGPGASPLNVTLNKVIYGNPEKKDVQD